MRQTVSTLGASILLIIVVAGTAQIEPTHGQSAMNLAVAQYTTSDELIFPADTDRWVLLGTNIGRGYSDEAFDPENPGRIGVVQIEPSAYAYLLENRRYADGTMFLLSLYQTQEKPDPALNGFVQGNLAAREIHIIDRAKYEDDRAFYRFDTEETETSAMLPPGNRCVQCHAEHGEFDSTFVQFYPTIRDFVTAEPE